MDRKTLAKIHIAKKDLNLSRDDYESMLSAYNVDSSKDLQPHEADELLQTFVKMGWKPKGRVQRKKGWGKQKYEHLSGRGKGFAKPAQLRKIEAIWRQIARDKSDSALSNFIERQTRKSNQAGIKNIEWLKEHHVKVILPALQTMQKDYLKTK